ncbi:MAG: hypothetical protein IPI73_24615 [Betaproteobacteria bacterium]|nr:hypothetical protein [Betaproteobacteria bacterium]
MTWLAQLLKSFGRVFGVIGRLKALFFLFVLVNVVVGSLGLTAPLLAANQLSTVSWLVELVRQLKAGGAYTFSIAFIASSGAFLIREYLDNTRTSFRSLKAISVMVGVGLAIAPHCFPA